MDDREFLEGTKGMLGSLIEAVNAAAMHWPKTVGGRSLDALMQGLVSAGCGIIDDPYLLVSCKLGEHWRTFILPWGETWGESGLNAFNYGAAFREVGAELGDVFRISMSEFAPTRVEDEKDSLTYRIAEGAPMEDSKVGICVQDFNDNSTHLVEVALGDEAYPSIASVGAEVFNTVSIDVGDMQIFNSLMRAYTDNTIVADPELVKNLRLHALEEPVHYATGLVEDREHVIRNFVQDSIAALQNDIERITKDLEAKGL
jgi:hypothetical protein